MMIQMVDRPNTTPIGQVKKTLTFKVLLYLFRPDQWFWSSMWISSVAGIYKIETKPFTTVVARATRTYLRMKDILCAASRKILVVCTFAMDRKCLVCIGNNRQPNYGVMYFSILICLMLDLGIFCFFLFPSCHAFQTRQSPVKSSVRYVRNARNFFINS